MFVFYSKNGFYNSDSLKTAFFMYEIKNSTFGQRQEI